MNARMKNFGYARCSFAKNAGSHQLHDNRSPLKDDKMINKSSLALLFISSIAFATNAPDGEPVIQEFHTCISATCSADIVRKFHIDQRALTGKIVYGEPFYVEEGLSDSHKTIFPPSKVLVVYNPSSGETYKPSIDYIKTDEGIKILPGSTIKKAPLGFTKNISPEDKEKYGVKLTPEFPEYQYAVTYEKDDTFTPVSYGSLESLPTLIGKTPIKVTFFGDSITEGANASSTYTAPNQPGYAELVMAYMNTKFPAMWEYRNNSVGGWSAGDAVKAATYRVADKNSDLIVLAFGMNDSAGTKPEKYKRNLQRIITTIRSAQPETTIILVSSTVANQESTIQKNYLLSDYLNSLRELSEENNNILVVDATSIWSMMLKNKSYYDITGNGINHPNDFGHRILAELLISAILGNNY